MNIAGSKPIATTFTKNKKLRADRGSILFTKIDFGSHNKAISINYIPVFIEKKLLIFEVCSFLKLFSNTNYGQAIFEFPLNNLKYLLK